jgi:aspartyl-tRNA(Asn)/glutamyl-tRNA(Gln) amidotransferase subunit A
VLTGIPLAIKDIVLTKDTPTTVGSRAFADGIVSDVDAPVVRKLRRAGAVLIGRTNLHELALGVTTVNEHFGPARNPWDRARVSGGSSGGSAVAVAAELCAGALGTDTRGSIRIPAACCGITGFKPTRGLVSTKAVIPLSRTLDHVGPMAWSVEDAAVMVDAMVGGRKGAAAGRYAAAARRRVRRLRVGVSEFHMRDLDAAVQPVVEQGIRELERSGVKLRPVAMPALEGAQQGSVVITSSEAVAFHDATLQANPEGYGPLVRQRLQGGYDWRAVDYLAALDVRRRAEAAFADVFEDVDALVGATLPVAAIRIGDHAVVVNGREANTVDTYSRLNSAQNMAGVPALSVPCGFTADGLPVGMQIIAAADADEVALALGGAFQRETDWHRRRPALG